MFNSKETLFGRKDENAQKEGKSHGLPQRGSTFGNRTETATPAPAVTPGVAEESAPLAVAATPVAPTGSKLIVGPDIKLKGVEITDCDTLVVEGRVEASMDSRVIQIAEHGVYSGTVGIDVAEIHGRFEGELTARKQLIIHATGRVSGVIRYGKITVEDGGEISGTISTLSSPAPATATAETGNGAQVDIMTPYDPFAQKSKLGGRNAGATPH